MAMALIVAMYAAMYAAAAVYADRSLDLNQLLRLGGLDKVDGVGAAAKASAAADPSPSQMEQALERLLRTATADASSLLPAHDAFVADAFSSLASLAANLAQDGQMQAERVDFHLLGLSNALESFPRSGSFPGVRRVVVASLALRRMRIGQFSDAHLQLIERLLLQLFDQHRDASARKRAIEFAHISKAGGTSVCGLAEMNGCATESFAANRNCQLPVFRDQPRYINVSQHTALRGGARTQCQRATKPMSPRSDASCEKRRQYVLSKGYTLYANEYTAFGGRLDPALAHPCTNMVTVLQIRHPHDRVISHISHVWTMYDRHCHEDRGLYFAKGHDTADWALLIPAPLNNYAIRSLLGEAVFNLPAGGVTREHLDLARTFLAQQYDVLLVLEESEVSARSMRAGLGWQAVELHVNAAAPDPEPREGLPANLELLWELNRLDLELYEYGVAMARLDAVVFSTAEALLPGMPRAQAAQPPPAGAAAPPTGAARVVVAAAAGNEKTAGSAVKASGSGGGMASQRSLASRWWRATEGGLGAGGSAVRPYGRMLHRKDAAAPFQARLLSRLDGRSMAESLDGRSALLLASGAGGRNDPAVPSKSAACGWVSKPRR